MVLCSNSLALSSVQICWFTWKMRNGKVHLWISTCTFSHLCWALKIEVRKSKNYTHTHTHTHTPKQKSQAYLRGAIWSNKWHANFLSEYYIFVLPEVYQQINDNGDLLIPVFHGAWEQIHLFLSFFSQAKKKIDFLSRCISSGGTVHYLAQALGALSSCFST